MNAFVVTLLVTYGVLFGVKNTVGRVAALIRGNYYSQSNVGTVMDMLWIAGPRPGCGW